MENNIPRRSRLDLCTPAEKAIYDAMQAVEEAGAHPLLTEAVILLSSAKDKVADYVDSDIVKKPLGDPPTCPTGYYWNGSRCVKDVG